ncbi:unnamed protein product [Didymodactylos carnosus]|uniref:Uncharacterized protein n=1 Tax=Didymodactylos carnosus TaxID=1234261 RepID=A0A8S2HFU9_9BILA|nr:unnamed protein product [Didymodactylos carnosus]CAF3642270.1 unnamed protein product [Didymodactylos carnosus]
MKKLPTTSTFTVDSSTRSSDDQLSPQRQEQRILTRLKVNNGQNNNSGDRLHTNSTVTYRDKSDPRRYSQPSSGTLRSTQRTTTTTPSTVVHNQHYLSKSVDRITSNNRSRRELRYEEHDDYIPPPQYCDQQPHVANIQCHPTIDHYNRNLNTTVYHQQLVPLYENNNQRYYYSSQSSITRKSQIDHIQPSIQVKHLPPPLPLSQHYSSSTSFHPQYYRQVPVVHYSTPSYNLRPPYAPDDISYTKTNYNEHHIVPPSNSSTLSSINSRLRASVDIMADDRENNNHAYGKLSDCRSVIQSFDNSTNIKAPRRIQPQNEQQPTRSYSPTSHPYQNDPVEARTLRNQASGENYAQFPVILDHSSTEPYYANTQSLYDNIVYPQSATNKSLNNLPSTEYNIKQRPQSTANFTRSLSRSQTVDLDSMLTAKKSCASQTQLTWTMATFSSFVDLENQSIIIPQPDPTTLYSIGSTISSQPSQQQIQKPSTTLLETGSHHHHHHHSSKSPTNNFVEKRDTPFQTSLTFPPFDDNSNIDMQVSSDSLTATGGTSSRKSTKSRLATRDVGLQVSIQTVKKITFSTTPTTPVIAGVTSTPSLSEPSSATSTTTSPTTILISPIREYRTTETNTERTLTTDNHTQSAPQEQQKPPPKMVTTSSQTTKSSETRSQQTTPKTAKSRDQWIETTLNSTRPGLFFCDLSSVFKEGGDSPLKKK